MVLEKTLESPLDCKEIKPVNPKGNQSWIVIGRTNAEAEAPRLWPPDTKNWLIGKDLDAGRDCGHEEKGMTEDKMVGWHHRLNGHEFEQGPGVGDGQGSLACCSPRGPKELDTTEQLNWNINKILKFSSSITVATFQILSSYMWLLTTMLDSITDVMDMSLSKVQELVKDRESWQAAVLRVRKSWTQLSDWTEA